MKKDVYYLLDNNGKILHYSGSLEKLINYTVHTKNTTIWFNKQLVWVQNP